MRSSRQQPFQPSTTRTQQPQGAIDRAALARNVEPSRSEDIAAARRILGAKVSHLSDVALGEFIDRTDALAGVVVRQFLEQSSLAK